MDQQQPPPPQYTPPPYGPPGGQGYYPPPQPNRPGVPVAVWIVLGVCGLPLLLVIIGAVAGVIFGYMAINKTSGHGGASAPGVLTGSLQWRTLQGGSMLEGALVGNFDTDADDELLTLDMMTGGNSIIDLDGNAVARMPAGQNYMLPHCAWDCDGDGIDELIVSDSQGRELDAMDLYGKVKRHIPYTTSLLGSMGSPLGGGYRLRADMDGDGHDELLVATGSSTDSLVALDHKGKEMLRLPAARAAMSYLLADSDGDGKAELATADFMQALTVTGASGTQHWGSIKYGLGLSGWSDVNGDGKADLVCGEEGYLDAVSRKYVAHKAKAGFIPPYVFSGTYVAFDYDGDGVDELVYAGPDADTGSDDLKGRLRIYQPATQMVLYDEAVAGGYSMNVSVAYSGGKAHLVVPLHDRLLVYP